MNPTQTSYLAVFTIPVSFCLFFGFLYPRDSLILYLRKSLSSCFLFVSISYLEAHQFLTNAKNFFVFTTLISAANKTTFIDIPCRKNEMIQYSRGVFIYISFPTKHMSYLAPLDDSNVLNNPFSRSLKTTCAIEISVISYQISDKWIFVCILTSKNSLKLMIKTSTHKFHLRERANSESDSLKDALDGD
jgi:hypothetical protein